MNRFLLIVVTLLTSIGAWGSVSFDSGTPYLIKHANSGLYLNMETAGTNAKLSTTYSIVYFTADEDGYTISNATNSLYATGWNANASASNSTVWKIAEVDGEDDTFTLNQQSASYTGYLGSDATTEGSVLYCNKGETKFVIKKIDYAPTISNNKYLRVAANKTNTFSVATSADDNNHWYLITNSRIKDGSVTDDESYNTPVYYTGAGATLKREARYTNPAALLNKPVDKWRTHLVRFISAGEGLYYMQFANGAYINSSLQGTALQSEAAKYYFYNTTESGYGFGWNKSTNDRVDNNGQGQNIAFWESSTVTATSGNNVWSVYPVTLEDPVTVTYKVLYGESNTEVASGTAETLTGVSVPSTPTSLQRSFCSYGSFYDNSSLTGDAITVVPASATTVYTKATWNGPFTIADDYASISNWYFLKLKNERYVTYESGSDPNVTLNQTSGTVDTRWAFVGNPYNGFILYNKTAGNTKVLASNGKEASEGSDGGNTYTRLVASNDGTYTHNLWYPKSSSDISGVTGFYLYDDVGYALNYRANANLAYWTSGVGAGSTFSVEADNINFAASVAAYSSYFEDANKDKYFGISTGDASELQDNYNTFSTTCNEDQYLAFRNAINNAINIPTTGYYRLKNKSVSSYLGATTGLVGVTSGTGAETVVKLTNNDNGTFYLATQGKYIKISNVQAGGQLVLGDVAELLQYTIPEAASVVFSFAAGNWSNKSIWLDNGTIKNGAASAAASKWTVEDATSIDVTLNDGGDGYYYATRYFDFPVQGDGLYILTSSGGDKVTATKVSAVPAGEGFLIRCAAENGSNNKVTLTIPATAPTLSYKNLFDGNCLATTVDANSKYIFSKVGDELGFFLYSGTSMPANRAYLTTETMGRVRGFVLSFEDEETGVASVVKTPFANNIFDLQGRRVTKTAKGLYIQNGKKIMY